MKTWGTSDSFMSITYKKIRWAKGPRILYIRQDEILPNETDIVQIKGDVCVHGARRIVMFEYVGMRTLAGGYAAQAWTPRLDTDADLMDIRLYYFRKYDDVPLWLEDASVCQEISSTSL